MSKGSFAFLGMVALSELSSINKLLSVAGVQDNVAGEFPEEELDRREAEQTAIEEMANVLSKESTYDLAAGARLIHEAARARRDINIAFATHKQLMLGSYKTLYQRKLKLEKAIEDKNYV